MSGGFLPIVLLTPSCPGQEHCVAKKRKGAGPCGSSPQFRLEWGYVGSLEPLRALGHLELHRRALLEGAVTLCLPRSSCWPRLTPLPRVAELRHTQDTVAPPGCTGSSLTGRKNWPGGKESNPACGRQARFSDGARARWRRKASASPPRPARTSPTASPARRRQRSSKSPSQSGRRR